MERGHLFLAQPGEPESAAGRTPSAGPPR